MNRLRSPDAKDDGYRPEILSAAKITNSPSTISAALHMRIICVLGSMHCHTKTQKAAISIKRKINNTPPTIKTLYPILTLQVKDMLAYLNIY
jgi:hypothetical protein